MIERLHTFREGNFQSQLDNNHVCFKQYSLKPKLNKKIKHFIIQHGAVEYHLRHKELIESLIQKYGKSCLVSCMDLIGHGYSGGSRAFVDEFNTYEQDFLRFTRVIENVYYDHEVETIVIAHSLGAMIILKVLISKRELIPFDIDKVIFINPCIKPQLRIPKKLKQFMTALKPSLGKIRIPSLYRGIDLTTDRQRAIDFDADHLNSDFVTLSMANEIIRQSDEVISYSYYINFPIFFLLSGDDLLVDNKITELFISGIDKKIVKLLKYPKMRHDLLNETCRTEVFQEIIDYVSEDKE